MNRAADIRARLERHAKACEAYEPAYDPTLDGAAASELRAAHTALYATLIEDAAWLLAELDRAAPVILAARELQYDGSSGVWVGAGDVWISLCEHDRGGK